MWRFKLWGLGVVLAVAWSGLAFAQQSTLDKVKERGELVAGVKYDYPPLGFVNEKGEVDGFEIDLMRAFAKKLGVKLKLVQVLSKTRIPLLLSGTVDLVAATMTHTRERDLVIDFSITYLMTGQRPLARKESEFKSVRDLAGKTVGAVQGGNSGPNLLKHAEKIGLTPPPKLMIFQEQTDSLLALRQKKVDATVGDDTLLLYWATKFPELEPVGKLYTREPYGLGVRQNDSKWRDWANFTLMELWESGELQKLYRKWWGADPEFEMEVWPK